MKRDFVLFPIFAIVHIKAPVLHVCPYPCQQNTLWSYALCERGGHLRNPHVSSLQQISAVQTKIFNVSTSHTHVICPRNHATHMFYAFDQQSACFSTTDLRFRESRESWTLPNKRVCNRNMTSLPPSFTCAGGEEHVPYTLVCDYRQDCLDNSDEDFCVLPSCHTTQQFECQSKQCVARRKQCDGFADCLDETDERSCITSFYVRPSRNLPAVVTLDGHGSYTTTRLTNWTTPCPDTHFKCRSIQLCLPVYLRCNGVNDCPEREDEAGCDESGRCPGCYRCRGFRNTFVHPNHLCDGWSQCPQHDDERFCNLTCPAQCSCLGHSWFCRHVFRANRYSRIRFLDAESSGMKPSGLTQNMFLIHLSLSKCGVGDFENITLLNLHSLDLEGNQIRVVTETNFKGLRNLNTLFLTGNPLTSVFVSRAKRTHFFHKLTRLDLAHVKMRSFNSSLLTSFPNLQTLNLSGCGIETITSAAFQFVPKLRVLDMQGCRLEPFAIGLLKPLTRLRTVRADNFKMCCSTTLPDSFPSNECNAPVDKISSCDNLFKSNTIRVSWHVTNSMAAVFNAVLLFKRLSDRYRSSRNMRSREKSAVDVFVSCLFTCGFFHAVYMTFIGLADASYRGSYMVRDTAWKHGPLCEFAGFLWLFSTETSLFLVGLSTLDRVLMSWCPRRPLRFSRKSAILASSVVAMEGVFVASVPFLPSLSRGKLFQQTALCSPLVLDSRDFSGGHYLFGVFSVCNVAISWLAGLGQLSVYVYLHRKRLAFVQSPNETKELSTSRRVMTMVLCDLVYWLVIGHSIYFIARGVAVSDNVKVLVQVSLMPLQWTLNPALHAVVTLLEHRRRAREERMIKILIAKRHS